MPSFCLYSKPCVKRPLSKRQKIGFQDQLSLNALSYNLSLRPLFCLILSGRLRQVLLYKSRGYSQKVVNRGSYMSAHGLLNLLNELGKSDQMRGLPSI